MCAIAVSPDIGLIRLYPLSVASDQDIHVWSRIRCKIRKASTDFRVESFRIVSAEPIGRIDSPKAKADLLNACILRSGDVDPITYQNAASRRMSIAVVKAPLGVGASLVPQDVTDVDHAVDEDDAWAMTQGEYPFKPYLRWQSIQGGNHETHLCSQEVYEGMRHNAATPFRVFENLHIGDPDYEHWMILGNQKNRPTTWLCAHLHRQKKICSDTSSSLMTFDGDGESWPYLQQEAINVKCVDPQKTFSFTM